jgi:hypothetical protein
MVRRGGIVVTLSLIGELWGTNNATLGTLLDNIGVVVAPGAVEPAQGFTALKSHILPVSGLRVSSDRQEIVITFARDSSYNIDTRESIRILVPNATVQ